MVFSNIIFIILSNANTLRRDFSLTISRVTLSSLLVYIYINLNSMYLSSLHKGLSLYNGLFQCNSNSQIFNLFLGLLSFCILTLTSYYPRKSEGLTPKDLKTFKVINFKHHPKNLSMKNLDVGSSDIIGETNINSYIDTDKNTNINSYIDTDKNTDTNVNTNTDNNTNTDDIRNSTMEKLEYNDITSNEVKIIDKTNDQFKILEYSLLILFILCGAIFLMSANDIVSIFISIELQSYGLYLLSSVYRNSELSTKAGLTYFLLGGLSSCIILLSQGLLYINSGNTNLENIYVLSNLGQAAILNSETVNIITDQLSNTENFYSEFYVNTSLAILSVGFLFKVSAAPFHFWSPDVYDGVPTLVTTFIAIIAKISIFVFLLELIHFTNNTFTELLPYSWNKNLLLSSLLSLIIGTVLGLTQSRIKRLYAYSTISHVGFILLALSINTTESIQAFIFYLIQYSVSNLNAFIILISVGYFFINFYNSNKECSTLKERHNSPVQLISQIKGLYKLNSMLALSFAITLFSFLGVPPLLGFFGKQMVLSASLDSGYLFMALVAILTSVISAVYYLVLIKQIFFDDNEYKSNSAISIPNIKKINEIKLSSNLTIIISSLTLITVIFMVVPTESLNLVMILSLSVFNV